MSKTKKPKSIPVKKTQLDPAVKARLRRIALHSSLAVATLAGAIVGFHYLRHYADNKVVFYPRPPKIMLKNRPIWMSDYLAEQIVSAVQPMGAHSTFDHQLLVDVADGLRGNPWIKKVNEVRRAYLQSPGDAIEVDCQFREPLALVHWKDYFWLVDSDGVKLPEQFTLNQLPQIMRGRDGTMQFRIIEGVKQPPVETGNKWTGEDLTAGLELARYLYNQPFATDIARIDVTNFAGRADTKEAQLVLLTSQGTEVRWGRPVNAKDYFVEVSVAQKLDYMKRVYAKYGRVDANQSWIDIRFDKITYPSGEATARIDMK